MSNRGISGAFLEIALAAVFFFAGAGRPAALSDVCPDICFPREDDGLFDCQTESEKLCKVVLMQGMEFLIRSARENFTAPVVEEGAARVLDGGAVEFSAKLKKAKKKSEKEEEGKELHVYYSFDGRKSWLSKKMRYDPMREEWTAEAEAGEEAVGAHYFFRAVDTMGNTYVEIPCAAAEFPPKEDCLAPLSPDQSYEDYEDFHVEPYMDILDSHVGGDAESLYFSIRANGTIEPGTKLPTKENYFFAAVMNPDRWNEREPYENTAVLIYSPMHFLPRDCSMFRRYGEEWDYDKTLLDCEVDGDRLNFRVPLSKALGRNESGYFTVLLGSGRLIGENSGIIKDYTMLTNVRRAERFVEIKR